MKSYVAGFLSIVLLFGSMPFSISESVVMPFSESVVISQMSDTAIEVLETLPEPKSENERMKKFDVGFYDLIQQKIQNKPERISCIEKLENIPGDSIPSKSENPQNSKIVDISGILIENPNCETHLISNQNLPLNEIQYNSDFHSVIIFLETDDPEDPILDVIKYKSRAELNKIKTIYQLEKFEAKNIFKAETLSFVIADLPIEKIFQLSDLDSTFLIGNGETPIEFELSLSKGIINAEPIDVMGLSGDGIIVAIVDSGINQRPHDDLPIPGTITNQIVCGSQDCPAQSADYTDVESDPGHGTLVAGIVAGNGIVDSSLAGVAPNSKLYNVKMSDYVSGSLGKALDWSITNGAQIMNLSFGITGDSPGSYTISSLIVDEAVQRGAVIIKSAGNEGQETNNKVTVPGTAFNVISVGNWFGGGVYPTSSRGPTDDGRIKPEVVAPGQFVISPSNVPDNGHDTVGGTSSAAAHVSGASSLLLEGHPEFGPLEMKSALILGADWHGPTTFFATATIYEDTVLLDVLNEWGFGLIDVKQSLEYATDPNKIIKDTKTTNETKEYSLSISQEEEVKIFLTWLKHPLGTVKAPIEAPVSDLTLTLKNEQGQDFVLSNSDFQNIEFIIFEATEDLTNYKISVTSESQATPIEHFVISSTHTLSPLQDIKCVPLDDTLYNWIITRDCILAKDSVFFSGNATIVNNSQLTIPSGLELEIEFDKNFLSVENNSGLLIKNGGTLRSCQLCG